MANFNSEELIQEAKALAEKLDAGMVLEEIQGFVNLPQLSEFSQLFEQFLPKNLIKFGEDGKVSLLSLTDLQQSLNNGLSDVKSYLEGEILGLFETVKGEVEAAYNEAKEIFQELNDLKSALEKNNSKIADLALETINGATGLSLDAQTLGSIHKTVTNTMESFTKLSPKQLRDLANPEYYKKVVDTTLNTALEATNAAALLATGESLLNDQLDSSGYIDLHKENAKKKVDKESNDIKVAVERKVYWGKGEGATQESYAKKSNSGSKLVNDYSLAVDNSNILIGAKVKFSDDKKEREAVDTATPSKGLSPSGTYPVIGIYFDEKEKALEYLKKYPQKYVTAIVQIPSDQRKKDAAKIKKNNKQLKEKVEKSQNVAENLMRIKELDREIADLEGKIATIEGLEAQGYL
jgi:hypothetical protein